MKYTCKTIKIIITILFFSFKAFSIEGNYLKTNYLAPTSFFGEESKYIRKSELLINQIISENTPKSAEKAIKFLNQSKLDISKEFSHTEDINNIFHELIEFWQLYKNQFPATLRNQLNAIERSSFKKNTVEETINYLLNIKHDKSMNPQYINIISTPWSMSLLNNNAGYTFADSVRNEQMEFLRNIFGKKASLLISNNKNMSLGLSDWVDPREKNRILGKSLLDIIYIYGFDEIQQVCSWHTGKSKVKPDSILLKNIPKTALNKLVKWNKQLKKMVSKENMDKYRQNVIDRNIKRANEKIKDKEILKKGIKLLEESGLDGIRLADFSMEIPTYYSRLKTIFNDYQTLSKADKEKKYIKTLIDGIKKNANIIEDLNQKLEKHIEDLKRNGASNEEIKNDSFYITILFRIDFLDNEIDILKKLQTLKIENNFDSEEGLHQFVKSYVSPAAIRIVDRLYEEFEALSASEGLGKWKGQASIPQKNYKGDEKNELSLLEKQRGFDYPSPSKERGILMDIASLSARFKKENYGKYNNTTALINSMFERIERNLIDAKVLHLNRVNFKKVKGENANNIFLPFLYDNLKATIINKMELLASLSVQDPDYIKTLNDIENIMDKLYYATDTFLTFTNLYNDRNSRFIEKAFFGTACEYVFGKNKKVNNPFYNPSVYKIDENEFEYLATIDGDEHRLVFEGKNGIINMSFDFNDFRAADQLLRKFDILTEDDSLFFNIHENILKIIAKLDPKKNDISAEEIGNIIIKNILSAVEIPLNPNKKSDPNTIINYLEEIILIKKDQKGNTERLESLVSEIQNRRRLSKKNKMGYNNVVIGNMIMKDLYFPALIKRELGDRLPISTWTRISVTGVNTTFDKKDSKNLTASDFESTYGNNDKIVEVIKFNTTTEEKITTDFKGKELYYVKNKGAFKNAKDFSQSLSDLEINEKMIKRRKKFFEDLFLNNISLLSHTGKSFPFTHKILNKTSRFGARKDTLTMQIAEIISMISITDQTQENFKSIRTKDVVTLIIRDLNKKKLGEKRHVDFKDINLEKLSSELYTLVKEAEQILYTINDKDLKTAA